MPRDIFSYYKSKLYTQSSIENFNINKIVVFNPKFHFVRGVYRNFIHMVLTTLFGTIFYVKF